MKPRSSSTQMAKIGDLCEFTSGHGFSPNDWKTSGLPIIRIQNLNGSKEFNYYQGDPDPKWVIEPGDLLFAWAGVKGVSFGPTIWSGPRGVLNQHIYKIHPKKSINPQWLNYALLVVTRQIENKSHGFKTNLVHVRKSDIIRAKINLPPLDEQEIIAQTIHTWDTAIEKTEQLIAAKEQRLRGLQQRFFKGTTWDQAPISKLFSEVKRQDEDANIPVATISAGKGFLTQEERFNRVLAGKNLANYTILQQGEFAYNKGSSKTYVFGCVYLLREPERLAIPNVYVSFSPKVKLNAEFYALWFEADMLRPQLQRVVNSGVRNDGLMNINAKAFFKLKVPAPPLDEQNRIARTLGAAKKEIDLIKQQSEALKTQKRGLMQKLLTGQWQVGEGK